MNARDAVACPVCGARNRSSWEFCARCDEPLEGAQPVGSRGVPRIRVQRTAAEGLEFDSSGGGTGVLLVTVLLFAVLSIAAYRSASDAPPVAGPDPRMFTIGSPPVELPEAPPSTRPGATDYATGLRLMTAGDPGAAVEALTAAVAADPSSAMYRSALAHALWRTGDRERAVAAHGDAARLDPRLQVQYARTLDLAGRPEDAAREYEAVLARGPESPAAREELGRLLYRSGNYADAAPHLQQAVANRPDDAVLRQELAYALDQGGDREQAATAYREVLEQAPDAVIARALLAENLFGRGQEGDAMTVLEQGLQRTPDAPLLHRQRGSLLERSRKWGEAAAAYRDYVRLAPNASDAAAIEERVGKLEGAPAR
jgi:tetratricopeptide (TPR) repeat protein